MIGVQRQLETGFEIKISTSNKAKLEAEIGKKAGDAEASNSKIEERIYQMPLQFVRRRHQTLLRLKLN